MASPPPATVSYFRLLKRGEAMNLVNAKYGHEPGLNAYTHVSDQFAPFASQTIPTTVRETPFILNGQLMSESGMRIEKSGKSSSRNNCTRASGSLYTLASRTILSFPSTRQVMLYFNERAFRNSETQAILL